MGENTHPPPRQSCFMEPFFTLFGTLFLGPFCRFFLHFFGPIWGSFLRPFYIFWDTFWDPDVNLQNKGLSISLSLYLLYSVALICVVPPPIDELGKWCQFIRTGVGAADIFLNWWYVEKTCSRLIMSWRMYLNVRECTRMYENVGECTRRKAGG